MATDDHDEARGGPKKEAYTFFVSGKKYETDQESLTGLQIKARVADWDPSHDLVLEGHDNDPDSIIADNETVQLDRHKGPLRFSSAPKANFG
jgi:Multiubiquitin